MAETILIAGSVIVPMPGCHTTCEGVGLGITRPYNKPWDIQPIFAANEPAKPPLQQES